MASQVLPRRFHDAYLRKDTYPENLRGGPLSQSPAALAFHRMKLDAAEKLLFETEPEPGEDNPIDVHFRDLGPDNDARKSMLNHSLPSP